MPGWICNCFISGGKGKAVNWHVGVLGYLFTEMPSDIWCGAVGDCSSWQLVVMPRQLWPVTLCGPPHPHYYSGVQLPFIYPQKYNNGLIS